MAALTRGMLLSSLLLVLLAAPSWQVTLGNLQVRLMNGNTQSNVEGRVEVRRFNNETWGTVCNSAWGNADAAVVCRQINGVFKWGERKYSYAYGTATGQIQLTSVQCRGNETNLGQCPTSAWGSTRYCSHYRDVAVKCHRYTARLVPQSGYYEGATYGAVEVLRTSDYNWLSVCDSQWDDNDARVVCKSLGHRDGKALHHGALSRGYSYNYRSASNITCTGSESSFQSCPFTYTSSRCSNSIGLASAICYDKSVSQVSTDAFDVRLQNGTVNWGRVEVQHLEVWGAVCAGQSWNDTAATVFCKQKNRGGGVVFGRSRTDVFQGSGWVTQLNCTGSETSLKDCVVPPWGASNRNCNPQYALCYSNSAPVVRLADGGDSYGRVEITMDGTTYTVCDDSWTDNDASVVCRNLGYGGGTAINGSYYGRGTGNPVGLNGLLCNGDEDNILQCRSNGWKVSTPQCDTHTKDVSVVCHGQVRLVKGDHTNGILEVNTDNSYLRICGTGFDDNDAEVACKGLGSLHGKALPTGSYGAYQGPTRYGSRPIWTNLGCYGNESSIFNCSDSSLSCDDSGNLNYASVHCYNGTLDATTSISLKGGSGDFANSSGHVRLRKNGVEGRICPSYWDNSDSKVACKQLGYSKGLSYGLYAASPGPILMTEINCAGTEASISHCPTGYASCDVYSRDSYYGSSPEAGVFCFNDPPPTYKFVGGASDREGRVEITYGQKTGTVCISDHYLHDRAASVVCKMKGYATGSAKSVSGGTGDDIALSDVNCNGLEESLLACKNNGFFAPPPQNCIDHTNDLGVTCQDEVALTRTTQQTNTTIVGIVQLYKNNRWNYLCGDFFDDNEAILACRALGYNYARALPLGVLGSVSSRSRPRPVWVQSINCTTNSDKLGQCTMQTDSCLTRSNTNYGSVLCSKDIIPQGIQAAQPMSNPGQATVLWDGLQSTVCSSQWDNRDATVYCKSLSFNYGKAFGDTRNQNRSVPMLVSNINCTGSETSLASCRFNTGIVTNCYYRARVFCYNSPDDFQVRLTGGQVRSEGRVEIGLNGQWSSVCDYNEGSNTPEVNVTCRSLGFSGGDKVSSSTFGPTTKPLGIYNIRCGGSEDSVTACSWTGYNESSLQTRCVSSPASVRCSGEGVDVPSTTTISATTTPTAITVTTTSPTNTTPLPTTTISTRLQTTTTPTTTTPATTMPPTTTTPTATTPATTMPPTTTTPTATTSATTMPPTTTTLTETTPATTMPPTTTTPTATPPATTMPPTTTTETATPPATTMPPATTTQTATTPATTMPPTTTTTTTKSSVTSKTEKPTAAPGKTTSEGQADDDDEGTNTAAIVAPIMVVLILGIAGGVGFVH